MKAILGYLCSSESWGGLEMNHVRNAEWMQIRGHHVVILCIANSPLERFANSKSLRIIHIEKQKKYYDFKKAKTLKNVLIDNGITHLIVRSTYDISIASNVKRYLKNSIHTSYFMEMQLGVKKKNIFHTIRYKYIDLWSCPLDWLKNQVEEWTNYKNALCVIPSGMELDQFANLDPIELDRQKLNLPKDKSVFGLIGRFDEQKGQLLLLQAAKSTTNTDYHIVFLGEPTKNEGDTYFQNVQDFIQSNQLENRVAIYPFNDNPSSFYNAIDWLVMATKAETFGMVTIEALACGTPVLGSNAGGTPEILENEKGGLLFKSMDPIDLAHKMDSILENKLKRDPEILKNMAQKYDHHSICEMVEKVLNI